MTSIPNGSTRRPGAASGRAHGLWLVCCALAALVVVLAVQNRRMKAALAAVGGETGLSAPVRARLAVGDAFEPFHVLGAGDAIETVAFEGDVSRTLLVVFAESCPACPAVMPTWQKLAPAFDGTHRRIVALRLDPSGAGGQDESDDLALGLPVFRMHDAAELPLAKLSTVPLTALLDEWGTVLWARYGEIDARGLAELVGLIDGPG